MKTKKFLALLLVLALVMGSLAACGGGGTDVDVEEPDVVNEAAMAYFADFPENSNMIEFEKVMGLIDVEEDMFLIDVRGATDYDEGHIVGAVNMPFGSTAIADNLEFIPNDVPVYVYCYSGQTAAQVTTVLKVAGKDAVSIKGGWNRGISKTAGFEAYVSTDKVDIPTDVYEVDEALAAAVADYFATLVTYNGTPFAGQNVAVDVVKEIVDNADEDYVLLSVRQAADYAVCHVPGAINIPFGKGMQEGFADLPKDKTIIVYCYSGQTASQVTAILRLLGYEAFNMTYGMGSVETGVGWLGAGLECEASE